MSIPIALPAKRKIGLKRRLRASVAVAAARLMAKLSPARLHRILTSVSHGARPATYAEAEEARAAVTTVSMRCAGRGCLERSIATSLMCRSKSTWPDWVVGVRSKPFGAHAWVEAEGRMVSEAVPQDYYAPILTVRSRG